MYSCPSAECREILFAITNPGGDTVLQAFPPELIDFDSTNVPKDVQEALREAIYCHAIGCYIASAIMVRKTLEELCFDQGAKGKNLNEKIQALGTKIVLPRALLDGLDNLRLLGSDAAHLESRTFNEVG